MRRRAWQRARKFAADAAQVRLVMARVLAHGAADEGLAVGQVDCSSAVAARLRSDFEFEGVAAI